ncbi:hypothetical protein C7212DRAFT_362306 [Tuber magnatum]|uniref:Uncharacterized protein n=1 Tax=Tuber magnatum TaxID=42249 RepID=A0A317SWG2_9PEZI|nr:hypothetical protein C7212DRAFT_362306 [Tuber magnatum]
MEVYTDLDKESFRTGFPPFRRPTGTKAGSEWCIAVMSKEGQILTALYSVIVTLLFIVCWKLVGMCVISLSPRLERLADDLDRRGGPGDPHPRDSPNYRDMLASIALLGFWNAHEPLEVMIFLWGYLASLLPIPRDATPRTRRTAAMLLILAAVWLPGSYAASILVAAHLIAGKVAPANPKKAYVPVFGHTEEDSMLLQEQRAPATLRSLASAEAGSNDHTIRKRFSLLANPSMETPRSTLPTNTR